MATSVLLLLLISITTISAEDAWHAHYHRLSNMLIHNSRASSLMPTLLGPHHVYTIPEVQLRRGAVHVTCHAVNADHAWSRVGVFRVTQGLRLTHDASFGQFKPSISGEWKATPWLRPIPCAAGTAYLGSNHRLRAAVQKGMEGRGMLKIGVVGEPAEWCKSHHILSPMPSGHHLLV